MGGPIQDSGFRVPVPIQDSGFWDPILGGPIQDSAGWLAGSVNRAPPYILPLLCKLNSAGCLIRWVSDSLLSMREIVDCTG